MAFTDRCISTSSSPHTQPPTTEASDKEVVSLAVLRQQHSVLAYCLGHARHSNPLHRTGKRERRVVGYDPDDRTSTSQEASGNPIRHPVMDTYLDSLHATLYVDQTEPSFFLSFLPPPETRLPACQQQQLPRLPASACPVQHIISPPRWIEEREGGGGTNSTTYSVDHTVHRLQPSSSSASCLRATNTNIHTHTRTHE